METLILLLFITSLASSQEAFGQEAEMQERINVDGSRGDGGGQPRTIYSQKHLSPHRMMHFGKRPSIVQPPMITNPQVYDLYQPSEQQQQLLFHPDKYPYLLTLELEHGQTLQPMPEQELSDLGFLQPDRNTMYSFERPKLNARLNFAEQQQQQRLQQVVKPLGGQRLSKLISEANDTNGSNNSNEELASIERALPSSNLKDDSLQQAIIVSTRSMQPNRANTLSLPKAYISSLLYGRQGSSSMPNFGSYNKKAEPKDNFFMHFGRK